MKKEFTRMSNRSRLVFAIASILLIGSAPAVATNLFWSADGTNQGGVGTWDTTNARWGTTSTGPFTSIWNNANVDSAEFGGTAGAVTVGANVTVNSLTFDVGGYSLAAGSTITFAGANPTITVNVTGILNTTL